MSTWSYTSSACEWWNGMVQIMSLLCWPWCLCLPQSLILIVTVLDKPGKSREIFTGGFYPRILLTKKKWSTQLSCSPGQYMYISCFLPQYWIERTTYNIMVPKKRCMHCMHAWCLNGSIIYNCVYSIAIRYEVRFVPAVEHGTGVWVWFKGGYRV